MARKEEVDGERKVTGGGEGKGVGEGMGKREDAAQPGP